MIPTSSAARQDVESCAVITHNRLVEPSVPKVFIVKRLIGGPTDCLGGPVAAPGSGSKL
jgi:hypothetical protein